MVWPSDRWRTAAVTCGWILVVAAVYYAAARLGLRTAIVRGQVTPLWPPTGIALVALCWLGMRALPGIALGAFLVNVTIGPTLLAVVAITAGNTLAPAVSYLLLRRTGFHLELDRFRDALALVLLGALTGMSISAAVGSTTLLLAGAIPAADFLPTASVWWTGDAMSVLTITPLLLVLRGYPWRRRMRPGRLLEAVAVVVAAAVVAYVVMRTSVALMFLIFPLIVWAAARFRLLGATCCVLVVSVLAVEAAVGETGPFVGLDLTEKMITLQAFNGSIALTSLLLAALTEERNRARRSLERASTQLGRLVDHLGPTAGAYTDLEARSSRWTERDP